MTIPLTGAGSLFVKLGHIGGAFNDLNALCGGTATARVLSGSSLITRNATLQADYAAGTPEYQIIADFPNQFANALGTGAVQTTINSQLSVLQSLALNTVIDMANTDAPLRPDIPADQAALLILIQQMTNATASVQASTVTTGIQTAIATPIGNPVFIITKVNGFFQTVEYSIPETITLTCTQDSVTNGGGATPKQEVFAINGQNAQNNELSYNWATSLFGSGATLSYPLCDAAQSNGGSSVNLLDNSEFVTATTPNLPDNFSTISGTVGTEIKQGTIGYVDSFSLQLVGTGSAVAIYQAFNTSPSTSSNSGGTPAILAPNTVYAVNMWLQVSATPGAGVLALDLTDGSNTILTDDAGNNATVTQSLTVLTNSWANFKNVFRTPANMPVNHRIRIRLSTLIDTGKSLFVDRLSLTPMVPLYQGGPLIAGFSASINPISTLPQPDQWTFSVTNAFGGFQKLFEQWFGMRSRGLQLPSANSPTVADSLIV